MFWFSLITLVAFDVACASGYWQVVAACGGALVYCLVIEQTFALRGR